MFTVNGKGPWLFRNLLRYKIFCGKSLYTCVNKWFRDKLSLFLTFWFYGSLRRERLKYHIRCYLLFMVFFFYRQMVFLSVLSIKMINFYHPIFCHVSKKVTKIFNQNILVSPFVYLYINEHILQKTLLMYVSTVFSPVPCCLRKVIYRKICKF